MGIIGNVILVEIRKTESIEDLSFLNNHEIVIKDFGYLAYFNGIAPEVIDDKITGSPVIYPIIGQSIDVNKLKELSVSYVNEVFQADEASKLEVTEAMIKEEALLRNTLDKLLNISGRRKLMN